MKPSKDVKAKAKALTDSGQTQCWLLANAAELDLLVHGLVPEDITRQASQALAILHDAIEQEAVGNEARRG